MSAAEEFGLDTPNDIDAGVRDPIQLNDRRTQVVATLRRRELVVD